MRYFSFNEYDSESPLADESGVEDPANWRGDNLLGKAITQVRLELIGL